MTGLGLRLFHFCALLVETLAGEEAAASSRSVVGMLCQKDALRNHGVINFICSAQRKLEGLITIVN